MDPLILTIPIALPVLGGFPLILAQPRDGLRRNAYVMAVTLLTSALALWALLCARREAVTLYSFAHGFAISLRVDGLSALFAGLVALMWPLALLYAFDYMRDSARQNAFFAFYTMTFGITLGLAFAANLTTLYVFYEMLSLVTIPLVAHYQDHESMFAARKYAAFTIGGAALAFMAVVTCTLCGAEYFELGGAITDWRRGHMLLIACAFGFMGFGVKAAVFPLHSWLPTASAAPTPVTALLHAVAVVNAGIFAVTRLIWYTYGPDALRGAWVQTLGLALAAFTLLYAAGQAVRERHFKRRLAYSTVSNLSYMLYGVMLLTRAGLAAALTHMAFHSIMKMTLFMCAGAFMHKTGNSYTYELNGIGRKMPFTFGCYTVAALSLTGLPGLCGFASKWMLVSAGIAQGSALALWGAACLMLSALLCAIYALTVSVRAYFPGDGGLYPHAVDEANWRMLAPIALFAALNIALGVAPQPLTGFINAIVG